MNTRVLGLEEKLDWMQLIRSENIGPLTFYHLLNHYGNATAALEAAPELAWRGGKRHPLQLESRSKIEKELENATKQGIEIIALPEPSYPPLLRSLDDAPPLLLVYGNKHLLLKDSVAIVGARNASAGARRLAEDLARDLSSHGLIVISGLARGIDTMAHNGSLKGGTIAVLAGGVDVIYPKENTDLYGHIRQKGVLVSEMPLGTEPLARYFPRRNRIISGCALGVIVVEAALRSGSLITARLALEQGRDVFAIPGSPLDPRSRGTNNLIRNGAMLAESAQDIITALEPMRESPLESPTLDMKSGETCPAPDISDKDRALIVDLLSTTPVEIDELTRQSGLDVATVMVTLLEMELAGRLVREPGQKVCLSVEN
ncbi:MAG: DNA-processing protein DprA [Parvularculales bacterium]